MKYEIIAEKLVGSYTSSDGQTILRQYHRLVLAPEEVANVLWWTEFFDYGDDPEQDYSRGMYTCQPEDCELDIIEADEFIEAIDEYIKEEGGDMREKDELASIKSDAEKLNKYKGYTLKINRKMEETKNGK